jgi:hypothetical protein
VANSDELVPCEHPGCKRWGCFGEPNGKETRWFCGSIGTNSRVLD